MSIIYQLWECPTCKALMTFGGSLKHGCQGEKARLVTVTKEQFYAVVEVVAEGGGSA